MSVQPGRPRGDRTRGARCMEDSNTMNSRVDEVFVGIDWGASHHQLCAVNATGKRQREVRLSHDVAGLNQLDAELAQLGSGLPICVERSEGLLIERLQAGGHRVFPVNPRIAARARERYRVASSKDDVFDAFTLADTLRHEYPHWRPLPVASPALAELRALSRDRDRLLESQQRVEAQLHAILDAITRRRRSCSRRSTGTSPWPSLPTIRP